MHGLHAGLDAPEGGRLFPDAPLQPQLQADGTPAKAVPAMANAIMRHWQAPQHTQQQNGDARQHAPFQLVCTGALTNAALLLLLHPELAQPDMLNITIMGGAIGQGNTGAAAEFNVQTDPEAAKVVFESGVPLTMVPLEVCSLSLALTVTRLLACQLSDSIRHRNWNSVAQLQGPGGT